MILVYLFKILFYVNDYFSYRKKKNSATCFKYSLIHTNRYLSYIFLDTCFNLQRSVITIVIIVIVITIVIIIIISRKSNFTDLLQTFHYSVTVIVVAKRFSKLILNALLNSLLTLILV